MGYTEAPPDWWKDFIAALPARTAKLAIVRKNGAPHVAPVWIDLDGDDVIFMTGANTIKGKAILRDPRVSLCLDDETPPFSFLTISGTATTSNDTEELMYWGTRIGGRYMGADQGEAYGKRNAVAGELLVRVTVNKIVAKVNIAD